ncbi:MAG: hypothetical protein LH606_20970 [Cytophagaceae bacterium]|nr:hypothetical protein [Cytophagaceae bacterium]
MVILGDTLLADPRLQLETRYGNTYTKPGSCLVAYPQSTLGPPVSW